MVPVDHQTQTMNSRYSHQANKKPAVRTDHKSPSSTSNKKNVLHGSDKKKALLLEVPTSTLNLYKNSSERVEENCFDSTEAACSSPNHHHDQTIGFSPTFALNQTKATTATHSNPTSIEHSHIQELELKRTLKDCKLFQSCPTNMIRKNTPPTTSALTQLIKQTHSLGNMQTMDKSLTGDLYHTLNSSSSTPTFEKLHKEKTNLPCTDVGSQKEPLPFKFELNSETRKTFLENYNIWMEVLSFMEEYDVLWGIRLTCHLLCRYSCEYERKFKTSFVMKHDISNREELKRFTTHNLVKLPNLRTVIITDVYSEAITYDDILNCCLRDLFESDIKLEELQIDKHIDLRLFELMKQSRCINKLKSLTVKSLTNITPNIAESNKSRKAMTNYLSLCTSLESLNLTFLSIIEDDVIPIFLGLCSSHSGSKTLMWTPRQLKEFSFVVSTISAETMQLIVNCCPNLARLKIVCTLTHHHISPGSITSSPAHTPSSDSSHSGTTSNDPKEIHALEHISSLHKLKILELVNPILTNKTLNTWRSAEDFTSNLQILRLRGNPLLELHRYAVITGDVFTGKRLPNGASKEQSELIDRHQRENTCSFEEMELFLRKLHNLHEIDLDLSVLLSNLDVGSPSMKLNLSFLGDDLLFPRLKKLSIAGFTSTMKHVLPLTRRWVHSTRPQKNLSPSFSDATLSPNKCSPPPPHLEAYSATKSLCLQGQMLSQHQIDSLSKMQNLEQLKLSLSIFNATIRFPYQNLTSLCIYFQEFTYMNLSTLLEQALQPLVKLKQLVIGSISLHPHIRASTLTTRSIQNFNNNYLEELVKAVRIRSDSLEILEIENQQLTEIEMEHLKVFKKLKVLKIPYDLNGLYLLGLIKELPQLRCIIIQCCCSFLQNTSLVNDFHSKMRRAKEFVAKSAPQVKLTFEEIHLE
ncbi:hypothetical protein C9374_013810 [Naegleria lovaniensis]|uniref:Uncharacterized protein n=1 Tax=Naegleria lovaniensis TaxID=51637 RepID=A0AA88KBF7_NAELO|nr:uncharacterized protein C9374_013810 [Naegleria lovaniensis]KAG2370854.1 hypothetical protein C9374_013810 [Naegleria lovaniensis]